MALNYFINRKETICVVSLIGAIHGGEEAVLQKCLEEVTGAPPMYLVLNMGGVSSFELEMGRPFTIFQQNFRAKSRVFACNFDPKVLSILKENGLVRENETVADLMSALQQILQIQRKVTL
jgi:hypothetical protein